MDSTFTIYKLKCAEGKYYIGKTKNYEQRIIQHLTGQGSAWTKKYPVLDVLDIEVNQNAFDEDKWVYIYMYLYGIENVRGGSYSSIVLGIDDYRDIEKHFNTALDLCYRCKKHGHFVHDCQEDEKVKEKQKQWVENFNSSQSSQSSLSSQSSSSSSQSSLSSQASQASQASQDSSSDRVEIQESSLLDNEFVLVPRCARCHRCTHEAKDCYAKIDNHGNSLPSNNTFRRND